MAVKRKYKPHIKKGPTGLWVLLFFKRHPDPAVAPACWPECMVPFMSRNTRDARDAQVWVANRNARILAGARSRR